MGKQIFREHGSLDLLALLGVGVGGCFFLYAASLYMETPSQWFLSWGFLACLWAAKRIPFFQEPPGRIFFLLLAVFITLRYWMFRTFDSLFFISFWDSLGMVLLYSAETYGILIYFLGMFVSVWPLRRQAAPLPADRDLWPAVDVFIPTYNEPPEMVMTTAIACTHLDYPREKLNLFILDDGATTEKRKDPDLETAKAAWERYHTLRSVAESVGAVYLTREKNTKAKAGNLNEALKVQSVEVGLPASPDKAARLRDTLSFGAGRNGPRGELILVLDCDHVPANDFLKNTVGYFLQNPRVFLVQTPHFFINPNPVEKNLRTFEGSPGENEMFYRSVQLGLDFWNSSFFCGSAAVLRREFLEQVGGIQEETITEDAETALTLHSRGLESVYLARPMICGLSPETFGDFITQRSRWTQGMLQIFSLKNPLWMKGLNWAQRVCYLNSCAFWFFGLARLVFFLAPLLYLFFGIRVYNASEWQVLGFALPHILAGLMVTDFLYGRVRHPFFSELYEAVQSMYLVPVILSTLLSPRSPRFKVTPKGKSLEADFLSPLAMPFYLLFFLTLIGIVAGAFRWVTYPQESFAILICSLWNIFNFLFVLLCLGVVWELHQRRRHHRIWAEGRVRVVVPRTGRTVPAALQDISLGGMSVSPLEEAPLEDNEKVVIEAEDSVGRPLSLPATVVRSNQRQGRMEWGCEFVISDLAAFSHVVRLVYGDSSRWVRFWDLRGDQRMKISGGLHRLARIGLSGAVRNFKGLLFPQWRSLVRSTGNFRERLESLPIPRRVLRALFRTRARTAPQKSGW